jgi:hypothetical protein
MKLFIWYLRARLICWLAGDAPVLLNWNVSRPTGWAGIQVRVGDPPYLVRFNVILCEERDSLLTPTRDVDQWGHERMDQ